MPADLVIAAEYLTYREAVMLYQQLAEADVSAWIKTCGPPAIPFMEGTFYRILVEAENEAKITGIVTEFKAELEAARKLRICPYCKNETLVPDQQMNWFTKIRYAGTAVYRCSTCGKRTFF